MMILVPELLTVGACAAAVLAPFAVFLRGAHAGRDRWGWRELRVRHGEGPFRDGEIHQRIAARRPFAVWIAALSAQLLAQASLLLVVLTALDASGRITLENAVGPLLDHLRWGVVVACGIPYGIIAALVSARVLTSPAHASSAITWFGWATVWFAGLFLAVALAHAATDVRSPYAAALAIISTAAGLTGLAAACADRAAHARAHLEHDRS